MGSQTSKTLQLLFVTANDIAYTQKDPPNKPNRNKPQQQDSKKKSFSMFSPKNLTYNDHWLPVQYDYRKFKPKKYYKDEVCSQELNQHQEKLLKKENLLKKFKYNQDFDRIDYNQADTVGGFQMTIDKAVLIHFAGSALIARLFVAQTYYHYYSRNLWYKSFRKFYLQTLPFTLILAYFTDQSHIINHQYFRSSLKDIRQYESLAYEMDIYQYVNDIKYNFKYPTREQWKQNLKTINQKENQFKYYDAIKYYKRYYGIVNPDPYLKNKDKQYSSSKND